VPLSILTEVDLPEGPTTPSRLNHNRLVDLRMRGVRRAMVQAEVEVAMLPVEMDSEDGGVAEGGAQRRTAAQEQTTDFATTFR
jgi:hypothetical protein